MKDDNEFQLFHKYNRLVRENKVRALICVLCGCNLITRLGKADVLMLWCPACNTYSKPGENTLSRVRGAVEEWML